MTPLGADRALPVDVRIVSATNLDEAALFDPQRFRPDLLYRLNTIVLRVPPLRERREDIPLLARHYLAAYAQQYGKPLRDCSAADWQVLQAHDWPGNVRALRHACERAVILGLGAELEATDFGLSAAAMPVHSAAATASASPSLSLHEREREALDEALRQAQGNISQAARLLGLSRAASTGAWKSMGSEQVSLSPAQLQEHRSRRLRGRVFAGGVLAGAGRRGLGLAARLAALAGADPAGPAGRDALGLAGFGAFAAARARPRSAAGQFSAAGRSAAKAEPAGRRARACAGGLAAHQRRAGDGAQCARAPPAGAGRGAGARGLAGAVARGPRRGRARAAQHRHRARPGALVAGRQPPESGWRGRAPAGPAAAGVGAGGGNPQGLAPTGPCVDARDHEFADPHRLSLSHCAARCWATRRPAPTSIWPWTPSPAAPPRSRPSSAITAASASCPRPSPRCCSCPSCLRVWSNWWRPTGAPVAARSASRSSPRA